MILPQLPQKIKLASKVVKVVSKIIILPPKIKIPETHCMYLATSFDYNYTRYNKQNPHICQSSLRIRDVWQSFHSREVKRGPWNEDMNIGYCDLMLCTFCTLIGTLLCIVALSFCHYFVISFCVLRHL